MRSDLDIYPLKHRIFLVKHFYQAMGDYMSVKNKYEKYYSDGEDDPEFSNDALVEVVNLFEKTGSVLKQTAGEASEVNNYNQIEQVYLRESTVDGLDNVPIQLKAENTEDDSMMDMSDDIPTEDPEYLDEDSASESGRVLGSTVEGTDVHGCELCGKVFTGIQSFQKHQLTHANETQFKCNVRNCQKTFKQWASYKAHKLTHSEPTTSTAASGNPIASTSRDSPQTSQHKPEEIEEQVNVKIETENLNCKFLLNNFVLSINRQPGNDLESFKVSAILHFVNDNFERHSIWLFSKQFHNEDADAIRTAIQSDIKKCFPQADKIWSKLISVSNVGVEKILPKTLPCILQQLNSVLEQSLDIKDDVDYYRFYNTIESVKKLMECTRLRSTGKNLMDRLELDETNQARYTVAVLKAFMEHKEDLEIRQADKDTDLEFIKNIDTNTVQYILELVKLFKDAAETLYYEQFNKPTSHLVFGVISSLIKNLEDIQISTVRVMMYMEHFGLRSRLTKGLKKIFKSLDGIYLAAHYLNPITSQSDKCLRFSDEQFQDKDMFIYENYEEIKEHFDIKKKPKYPLPRWVRNRDMEDVYDVSGRNREEECYEKARIAADTDILEFWKNHKGSEILRIIALQVLSVPAATACSGKSIFAWS